MLTRSHRIIRGGRVATLLLFLFCLGRTQAATLDWETRPGYRTARLTVPATGSNGFVRLPGETTGIRFTNRLDASRYLTNQIYLNGSGVALGDVDGDGWCDIFLCGLSGASALYRNLGGFKFENATAAAGIQCRDLDVTGAVLVDIDGDGDLDLIVNSVGEGTVLFFNDGRGHFTRAKTINPFHGGSSLALADIDGDGTLDLYVANYRTSTIRDHPNTRLQGERINGKLTVLRVDGRPTTEPDLIGRYLLTENGKITENGEVDALFKNDGKGNLALVPFTGGAFLDERGRPLTEPPYDWGLSAQFRDLNGDGAPDLYVCNDFDSVDRIWINDGTGRFRAIAPLALRHTSRFSMGVDFADLNRDGFDEIFVADMLSRDRVQRHLQVSDVNPLFTPVGLIDNRPQYSHNTLFANRGDGTYAEIAFYAGLAASDWSWTPVFLDVDLDGYEDLLITTGHELDMMNADVSEKAEQIKAAKKLSPMELLNLRKMFSRFATPKIAFRNLGGFRFEDASQRWGFNERGVSHGMAMADLDNDGDMDLVVNNLNGEAGVYRNESTARRVEVQLKGEGGNRQGIGAKMRFYGGAAPVQSQEMISGGRYLSGDQTRRVFAPGTATNAMRLEVQWRSGRVSVVENVEADRIYEIDEAAASGKPPKTSEPKPIFEDVSGLIGHRHWEEPFDDFSRQALMPRRLSQLGPGAAWHDVDGDGWEDLVIGSGRGGRLAVYRNNHQGGFEVLTKAPVNRQVARDQTAIVGVGRTLLIGSANYEDGLTNGGSISIYDLARGVSGESVLGPVASTGPIILGDVDGDGDLDLFVGGRVIAGKYPEAATSRLLRNEGGRWVPAQTFEKIGLVSGAVFSDLDGDGAVDLILACEWGPVRIFKNSGGQFTEVTEKMGLARFTGWWNGVATGDLDGDGRPDIIASNWGLNSRYQTAPEQVRRIYFSDFDGDGRLDIVEGILDEKSGREVPDRGWKAVRMALPMLEEKIHSFEQYGQYGLKSIYGEKLAGAGVWQAATLSSMVFFNRGDHFEAVAMPAEAQWSPAFAVCVGDYDGDGNEDVFLSQNFFATDGDTTRHDAGRGLWLKGDGKGGLTPVSGATSGVAVYGEQRGAALADYDADGRVDLVVTQNGAQSRLYRNVGAKPGLRVRLQGGEENPAGIGGGIRIKYGGKGFGPLREVQGGSGYWSQNGAVQVMAMPEFPSEVLVRWPGGKTTRSVLAGPANEISINAAGELKVVR